MAADVAFRYEREIMDNLTISDIQKIIAKDESRTLELKTTTGELDKGMASACAFLNSDGGWLIFGVSPKLKIIGQKVTDNTKQEIARHLKRIEPSIDIPVQYIPVSENSDLYVVAIYFDPTTFSNAPYTYDGRPYYKVESTTVQMPLKMYDDRLKISNPERFSWEKRPNSDITLDELNTDDLFITVQDSVARKRLPGTAITNTDPMRALKGFHLVSGSGVMLNAANVLFGRNPTMHHMQCMVRMARFAGTTKREFLDQAINEGNLFAQYDAILDFCTKHLLMSGNMDGKVRIDTLTVPYPVLREAAINMLVHRSWNADNLTPSLAIFDDRMVFQNPGSFPSGYTWRSFLDNAGSMPPNPLIASVFYRRGLMENWGRGINLIIDECVKAGLPEPAFEADQYFVNLTIFFKESIAPAGRILASSGTKESGTKESGTKESGTKESDTKEFSDTKVAWIYDEMKNDSSVTTKLLSERSGIPLRTVRRAIDELTEKGYVIREGGRKGGHWRVL